MKKKNTFLTFIATFLFMTMTLMSCSKTEVIAQDCYVTCANLGMTSRGEVNAQGQCICYQNTNNPGGGTGYTGGTGTPTSYGFESGQIYGFDMVEDLGDSKCACADFKVGSRIQPNSCGDGVCDNFPNSTRQDNSYQMITVYARLYDGFGNPMNQNGFPAFASNQVMISRSLIKGGLNMLQNEANAMHGVEYTVYLDGIKRTQRIPPIQYVATKYSCIIGYGTGGGTSVLITSGSVMPRQ